MSPPPSSAKEHEMSLFDYLKALKFLEEDPPFYGLIMAAMIRADTRNTAILRNAFPEIDEELQRRYDALGGVLDGD
jgi:hypothetical protein